MRRRCISWVLIIVTALLVLAAGEHYKYYWLARNFRVVEPGRIYRGGVQKPWPLRRIVERYHIRTVLCLADPERNEQAVARSMDARWLKIPIRHRSRTVRLDRLDRVADILANRGCHPIFFHCEHGRNRCNLAEAAFHMKHCGWTLEQALEEIRDSGYNPEVDRGDVERKKLLTEYYRERVLGRSPDFGIPTRAFGKGQNRGP